MYYLPLGILASESGGVALISFYELPNRDGSLLLFKRHFCNPYQPVPAMNIDMELLTHPFHSNKRLKPFPIGYQVAISVAHTSPYQ